MFLPDVEVEPALDARFRNGPSRELILSLTEPTLRADGAGYENVTEPAAASYAPVPVPPTDWSAAADRATEATVQFPDPVDDLGVIVAWLLRPLGGGVPTVAGVPAEDMDLVPGTSNVTITCRVEAPLTTF